MIDVLYKMTKELPKLLKDRDGWDGRLYEWENTPGFKILSRKVGAYRIGLHEIDKGKESMVHPHPWPSAAFVIQGGYEMYMGYGKGKGKKRPPLVGPIFLFAGSHYEMKKREIWHSVRPLSVTTTLFVFGRKYPNQTWGFESDDDREDFPKLTQSQRNNIFDMFDRDQTRKMLKAFKKPKKTKITYYW